LSAVAVLAARGGAAALTSASVRPFVPLLPMLAQIAEDFEDVLEAHGGTSALEYKYDGARIQLHRDGERVGIWTRRLSEVTRSLPDVVESARRGPRVPGQGAGRRARGPRGEGPSQHVRAGRTRQALVQAEDSRDRRLRHHRRRSRLGPAESVAFELPSGRSRRRSLRGRRQDV